VTSLTRLKVNEHHPVRQVSRMPRALLPGQQAERQIGRARHDRSEDSPSLKGLLRPRDSAHAPLASASF